MTLFKRLPVLYLLPLLLLYIVVALLTIDTELGGDQARYLMYAQNIIDGGYAIDGPLFLWNGPGYPIILAPFVWLGMPLAALKFINVFFLFSGIVLFYRTCLRFLSVRHALWGAYLLGLYYPQVSFSLRYLLSEGFAFFLASTILFLFCEILNRFSIKKLILASLALGFLILTKVIFAYVVLGFICVLLVLIAFRTFKAKCYRLILICLLANAVTLPYLTYTYSLTGEFPYYANSGGQCLYWLSTPYEGEQGEWVLVRGREFEKKPQFENHNEFFNSIETLEPVEKDKYLKEKAFENILSYPKKFLKNYISNVSRLFLDIPNSYTYQEFSFILLAVPNSFLFVFICLSTVMMIPLRKRLPLVVTASAAFAIIYLLGSSLLCAYSRMLFPALPFLFFWIFYMIYLWKNPEAGITMD
ncbi:hypothetical protein AAU57_07530 [Nonlabens sp. YIK11]|uniref:ArnT family glycosyltransferase n=1 Tax=Nonlabens sp. YIK11 TaxID=1453349 RepID=UPI0006DC2F33|nr:hypothetical protein [Nonlabens sp. YIK11]KQC33179.1 hypothetical protein AAU57_07530 [Nonlabens sp. YIK11]